MMVEIEKAELESMEKGLELIGESRADQFEGDFLAWGWWCRDVAGAALRNDMKELGRLRKEKDARARGENGLTLEDLEA